MNAENELDPMRPFSKEVDVAELFAFLTMALEDAATIATQGQAHDASKDIRTQLIGDIRPHLFRSANLADQITTALDAPDG